MAEQILCDEVNVDVKGLPVERTPCELNQITQSYG